MRRIVVVAMFLFPTAVVAEIDSASYLKNPVNKDKVIKSVNSGLCHPPSSSYRSRVKIEDDESNVFKSVDECIKSGGDVPDAVKEALFAEDPIKAEEMTRTAEKAKSESMSEAKFAGLNWGAGLAFAFYKNDFVKDVTIESGIVKINHEVSNSAIAMLESHYFWTPGKEKKVGHGPYVTIGVVGEDGIDPLSIYGLGYMVGFRRPDQGTSWNIGLGYFIDTEAKTLRNGIEDGDATSETDPAKLLRKSDQEGIMLMFSANL